jgi:hypothetical protein
MHTVLYKSLLYSIRPKESDLREQKTKQPSSCLGNPLPPAKYSTSTAQSESSAYTEGRTSDLEQELSGVLSQRTVVLPIEPHLHDC